MAAIIQGNSIARDIKSTDVGVFDTNWGGVWAIVATLGGVALAQGTLLLNTEGTALMARVLPEQSSALPVGDCLLIIQVDNPTLGFRKEFPPEKLTIKAQGIPIT